MSQQHFKKVVWIAGVVMVGLLSAPVHASYAKFTIGVYTDKTCSDSSFKGPIDIDTTKPCLNYSYVDSKGKTTQGSNGHFRCYADKVVYDKYPFASDCDTKAQIVERDHAVPATACLEAPSHEGPVYEKLVGYTYPGSENCQELSKVKKK